MSDLRRYFGDLWEAEGAPEKLYFTHNLNEKSVVFEVGGYCGEWASKINQKYHPKLYVFEPITEFYIGLTDLFTDQFNVQVLRYGLASRDSLIDMSKCGAASGVYIDGLARETVYMKDVGRAAVQVLWLQDIAEVEIDLISINIEGGEYDLLPAMFNSHLMYRCKEIMVQFHPLWPSSYDERNRLRQLLLETHEEVWCYPFCWEKWRRR